MRDRTTREISAELIGMGTGLHEGKPEFLVTEVSYDKGGTTLNTLMNTGKPESRGYWLRVRPETRHEGIRSFTLFRGCKALLEPAARFSAAKLASLKVPEETLAGMKAKVMADRAAERARAEERRR